MAEEWRGHHRRDGNELYHSGDHHERQRFDFHGDRHQFRGLGYEHYRDADRDSSDCCAELHRTAGKRDGYGWADCDVLRGSFRHAAFDLPVAEEWRSDQRSEFAELHHAGYHDERQWSGLPSSS